jgi:hypothetical protein
MKHAKRLVLWTVLAFFIYAIVTSPSQAASLVHATWNIIVEGVKGTAGFFNAVLNRK